MNALIVLLVAALADEPVPASEAVAEPTPQGIEEVAADLRDRAVRDQDARKAKEGVAEVDADNTEYLKSVVATWGWPDAARFGEEAANGAWLILQHTKDLAFQREGLALIEPKLAEGAVKKSQYALLVDRVRIHSGELQLYGSQFRVDESNVLRPCPVEDPDGLEARRAAMELPTMKEYRKRMASISEEKVKLDFLEACPPPE